MPCHPHRASGQGFEPRSARSERAVLPVAPARDLSCQGGTRTHTVASNGPPRYPLRHLTMRAPGEIRTPTTQGRSLCSCPLSYGRLSSWVAEDSNLARPGKSRMLSPPSSQPHGRHGWSRTIVFRVSDGCSPVEPRAFVAIWIFQGLRGPGRTRTDVPWLQARRSSRLSYRPIVETEGIEPPPSGPQIRCASVTPHLVRVDGGSRTRVFTVAR